MFSPQQIAVRQFILVAFSAICGLGDGLHCLSGDNCCSHSWSISSLIEGACSHGRHHHHHAADHDFDATDHDGGQVSNGTECAICKLLAMPASSAIVGAALNRGEPLPYVDVSCDLAPKLELLLAYDTRGPPQCSL